MASQLNDLSIFVNNVQVSYTADSLSWKDGFGEYNVRNAVVGGGETEPITSQNLESKKGMVKFSMPTTIIHERLKREWKQNFDQNVIEIVAADGQSFTKFFERATMTNDPESSGATDGNIEVEFETARAQ